MISTFGWICICFFLLIIKYAFLKPMEDQKLYRLYEARDNVALAAIEGKISQNADEYKFVIENINAVLYYMKNNYDFSVLIKNIVFEPEHAKKYFDHMMELVEQYDFLKKNYNLSDTYFQKSLNVRIFILIHLIIKPFYYALCVLIFVLRLCDRIANLGLGLKDSAERRINIMDEIRSDYSKYRKSFAK